MTERSGLTHRTLNGWISDFSSQPSWEPWPSIKLDQRLMSELFHAFDRAQQSGFNELILWGLLCGRSWSPYLPDTVSPERKILAQQVIAGARSRGLKVMLGLGVYGWGFEEIIAEHPELDGGHRANMCGSQPESQAWMERIIDFVMDEYDPDGLSMQSSDLGRCPCDACQEMSAAEYHAEINYRTTAYIRSHWPEKLQQISSWGMDFGKPEDLVHIQRMTANVDILNDYNNSAARPDPAQRAKLIASLDCAYGTEPGWWVDPQPFWRRDKWFLPITVRNVPYWRQLHAEGGDAVERYILPLANPGAEVALLFEGVMYSDLGRDPIETLGEALGIVFDPRSTAAREGLIAMWRDVEDAFLANSRHGLYPQEIYTSLTHYARVEPDARHVQRPEYLLRMKSEGLKSYGVSLQHAAEQVVALSDDLGNQERATYLLQTLRRAHADVQGVLAYRHD